MNQRFLVNKVIALLSFGLIFDDQPLILIYKQN